MIDEITRLDVAPMVLDSAAIDNRLLIALAEHTRTELEKAKWQLSEGLRRRGTVMGFWHLERAAKIINGLLGGG